MRQRRSRPTAAALAVHHLLNTYTMHPAHIKKTSAVEAANDHICEQRAPEDNAEAPSVGDMWRPLLPPAMAGAMTDGADIPKETSDAIREVPQRPKSAPLHREDRHAEQKRRKKDVRVRATRSARLIAGRKLNGWDQEEAARRLGYANSSQLCKLEGGSHEINIDHIANAAEVYRVSTDFLMGLESAEQELDIRARIARRVEEGLRTVAEVFTQAIDARYRVSGGATAGTVRTLAEHAKAVVAALRRIDSGALHAVKGGSTLAFAVDELATAVAEAVRMVAGYDGEMDHLRNLLRNTTAAND